jgi:hypothetical protein
MKMRFQETVKPVMLAKSPDGPVYAPGNPSGKSRLKLVRKKKNTNADPKSWFKELGIEPPESPMPQVTQDSLPGGAPLRIAGLPALEVVYFKDPPMVIYGQDFIQKRVVFRAGRGENNEHPAYCFDFSKWVRGGKFTPIIHTEEEQGEKNTTLYVSTGIAGYAKEAGGKTAYLSAIDTKTGKLIWQTTPLVANCPNFVVLDDVIICGYGFTKEPDFLFVIDKKTGRTLQKIPVTSGPEYIHFQGDGTEESAIFVRCYDTDYVFDVV